MSEIVTNPVDKPEVESPEAEKRWRFVGFSTLLFSVLQAVCPAVIAVSAVRAAIGVGSIASAAGVNFFVGKFHQDAIRIPMMLLAFAGAALNLFVIWHLRRLRSRPSSQWRQRPVPKEKLRSERIQIAFSVMTFVFLAVEQVTHWLLHRATS